MIRNNETMTRAAAKEVELLHEIAAADPERRYHCVRLLHHTEHRAHTALIFESLAMNLREALKKFGKHVGINITAVRVYAKQLLLSLRHLKKLKCSGNNIETLPEELGKCNQLEELICSENKLVALPRSVGNMRKLHTLLVRRLPLQRVE